MRFNAAQSIKNLFKPVDLTKGKPYKQLIIFVIPILISYIFQQVYTISDAACFRGTPDPALDGLRDDALLFLGGSASRICPLLVLPLVCLLFPNRVAKKWRGLFGPVHF